MSFRWQCDSQGCFAKKKMFRFDLFSGCFAGKIAPTDVDFMAEVAGRFLLLEFKEGGADLQTGQRIALERLVSMGKGKVVVAVVRHDEDMRVMEVKRCQFSNGSRFEAWAPCNDDELKSRVKSWHDAAQAGRLKIVGRAACASPFGPLHELMFSVPGRATRPPAVARPP